MQKGSKWVLFYIVCVYASNVKLDARIIVGQVRIFMEEPE